jgi:hypothetical protein
MEYGRNRLPDDRTIGPPKEVTTWTTAWVSVLECTSMDGRALAPAGYPSWYCRGEECEERGQGAQREPISQVGG